MIKEIGINLFCCLVLAPILAFVIFAISWWGSAAMVQPQEAPLAAPANQNATDEPPGSEVKMTTSRRPVSGRLLFLANCASCHGADGSGQGELVHDRPARSFREGGFSFGNTLASLRRVIESGIPGTPMPGFRATLDPRERVAVAKYVQGLGPPVVTVDPDDTILRIEDRPRAVRGPLASVTPDGSAWVRGLLTGGTDGISWEYRTDDVRLLAVRQGEFVQRRNWTGRSGDPLRPLGRMINVLAKGRPGPSFLVGGVPVRSIFRGTSVSGEVMAVRQSLEGTGITVEETGGTATVGTLAGYVRHFAFRNASEQPVEVVLHLSPEVAEIGEDDAGRRWYRSSRPDGATELTGLRGGSLRLVGDEAVARWSGGEDLEVTTLLAPAGDESVRAILLGRGPSS